MVQYVAKLASIRLSDEEVRQVKVQLNDIIGYLDKLAEVPTTGVVPTSRVHGVVNAFRDDVVKESLPRDAIRKIAPDFDDRGFKVPRII